MKILTTCIALAVLIACTPRPQGGSGISSDCQLQHNQTGQDLRVNCTVTAEPPNTIVDPFNSANRNCGPTSLLLFSQSLTAPATFIYGENGWDDNYKVRIGVTLGSSTHSGQIAKTSLIDCPSTYGPTATVTTDISGRHIAFIDKQKSPMCVYQSRFTTSYFNQTITENLTGIGGNLGDATRSGTEDAIGRQLDLEAAKVVNQLLRPGVDLNAAFENRSGRCSGDYQSYAGN